MKTKLKKDSKKRFITDNKGEILSVILPIDEYNNINN